MEEKKKSKRGFANMSKERLREICSKGGKAAHVVGTAHKFTSEEARVAGRKGGFAVSRNSERMREIGRMGGKARIANWRKVQEQLAEVEPKPTLVEQKES